MISILITIAVFGALVAFHEFGHLLAAKLCGMKVDAFSIGFGPKLFSFKMGETEYCLSLLPLGGYMKSAGPEFLEDVKKGDPDIERYYVGKPAWKRFLVAAAGPIFNLLLAAAVMAAMAYHMGFVRDISPVIGKVVENSPAARAELQPGDKLISLNGEKIGDWMDFMVFFYEHKDESLKIKINRGNGILEIVLIPEMRDQRPFIGIVPVILERKVSSLLSALLEGVCGAWKESKFQLKSLVWIVKKKISHKNLGGPIMIFQVTAQAAKMGFSAVMGLFFTLNIALGIFNLLPIPILDGGRMALYLIEIISRRRLGKKLETSIMSAGVFLILLIFLLVTCNDIARIFSK